MKNKVKEFVKWLAYIGDVVVGLMFLLAIIGLCVLGMYTILRHIGLRPAEDPSPAEPADGVARIMPEAGEVPVWLSPVCAGEAETAVWLDTYTEGDGPAPEWYRPDEPMTIEWEDHSGDADEMVEAHPPIGIDPGGVDWNLCSTVWGWDGHGAEAWEMDLFARIVYLEFWGTSRECCEAGVDAILQLWDSGYFAPTLYGTLSAEAENGAPVFSTWEAVWSSEYDPDGLADMRRICEERFYNGPEYEAEFFRTDYYHPWAEPMYQIDNVYFSTGKGWN